MICKLHVYTGDGKGKTTAAMGLALRSLGHGNTVLVAQFMKKGNSGELIALQRFENALVLTAPPIPGFTFQMTDEEKQITRTRQTAFAAEAVQIIKKERPQTVILDEMGMALACGVLDESAARELLDAALQSAETAVTGREVSNWLAERADYLSRIQAERHPFAVQRLPARKGVEW